MQQFITAVFSNFTLTFLVMAIIATAASWTLHRHRAEWDLREKALAFFLLFEIGFCFFYNFVMHVFFGEMTASFIGWADSPFQAEVGWASLGFALLGFLGFRMGFEMRLAAVASSACFLLGAAAGHVYQMVTAHNFAPGNAGVIFWSDILVPAIGFWLLWLRYREDRAISTSSS